MTPDKEAANELAENLMTIARLVQSRRPVSQARWDEVTIGDTSTIVTACSFFAATHSDAVHAILIAVKDIVRAEAGLSSF